MQKVTNLAAWRAARTQPVTDACRWSQALETVWLTHWRIAFAWQRTLLRLLGGQ